jgi:hypothetical protein
LEPRYLRKVQKGFGMNFKVRFEEEFQKEFERDVKGNL